MRIVHLEVKNYRGLEKLHWSPSSAINFLIGPGDSGKSTVVSALELALAPRPVGPASDGDYRRADFDAGFRIRVVIGDLTDELYSNTQAHVPLQSWDGTNLGPAGDPEPQ